MVSPDTFRYEPIEDEPLSMAVVSAVAKAHHEDVIDQHWILANDINPDALDELFQPIHPNMSLQFEADKTTVTIKTDDQGILLIEIKSHR